MARITRNYPVQKVKPGATTRRTDSVAVEEPLEVRLDGTSFAVTMRTPGDDIDLIHGLLHSEGIIAGRGDVSTARYCDGTGPDGLNTYNVLDVSLAPGVARPDPGLARNVITSSACGICGTTSIDQVLRQGQYSLDADQPGVRFGTELIMSAPDVLRKSQRAFEKTGGLHAAGLLTADGKMLCVREDVGRHNAVDKVIGWAIREDLLPLRDVILAVSGRASFELTQKAVLAGIPVLAAVSAPSSLAVDLAAESGLTLVGFIRGESMNIYTHAERVLDTDLRAGAAALDS